VTFKQLLLIKAAVCLGFGTLLLVVPRLLVGILGAEIGDGGAFTAREYGAAMMGTLILTWFARHAKEKASRRAILLDLLVYDAIGVGITVAAVLAGTLNALGWGIVAVYLFFTAGSAWVLHSEKQSEPVLA
jgi:hypothetical protein